MYQCVFSEHLHCAKPSVKTGERSCSLSHHPQISEHLRGWTWSLIDWAGCEEGGRSWWRPMEVEPMRRRWWPSLPGASLITDTGNEGIKCRESLWGAKAQQEDGVSWRAGAVPPGRCSTGPGLRLVPGFSSLDGKPCVGVWVEGRDFMGWVRGSGRQAGGRWLSRNPRSHFNNLFQN